MNKSTSASSISSPSFIKAVKSTSFNVLGFVPAMVVKHLLQQTQQCRSFPESQLISTVVMFANISGFEHLTDAVSKMGNEGAEVIARSVNHYMELLVKSISRSGGDVFKFAGDAMIVLWPPPGDQVERLQSLRQAIQSALDIQARMSDPNIFDKVKLSVKIGFGTGDINIIHVGGVFSRCEYIATGRPLIQAFESEHHSKKGETVVSKEVFQMVEQFFTFEEVVQDHNTNTKPFYYVKALKHQKVQMKADALLIKSNLTEAAFEHIKPQILTYIPGALIRYIENDKESWASELRRLTILSINLSINLEDAMSKSGLSRIQKVIETVQKCIYYHQGSLNKILMEDRGSTLIVVFGLPPLSHQDDPVRAILTSFSLLKELATLNCDCSIGISTGTVFSGVIGTSGLRREYSVIGDSVILSKKLMQQACMEQTNKIICCDMTAVAAQHKVIMKYYKMIKLQGKQKDSPIFVPTMATSGEVHDLMQMELFSDIRTHLNSLVLFDMYDTQQIERIVSKCFNMVGRQNELNQIERLYEQFLKNIDPHGFIVIGGTYGIGKSLFVRVVLQKIRIEEHKLSEGKPLTIIVSSLGPITKTLHVNGFRQVLQQLFAQIAKQRKRQANQQFFHEIVPQGDTTHENYELFKELVGVKANEWIQDFPPQQKEQVESQILLETKQITVMSMMLFKFFVDELTHVIVNERKMSQSCSEVPYRAPQGTPLHTMIIVLEDLNLYDAISFHLIKQILVNFQRVLFISTVRDQHPEIICTGRKASQEVKEKKQEVIDDVFIYGLKSIEDALDSRYFNTIEIRGLRRDKKTDELRQLIKQSFNLQDFILEREKVAQSLPLVAEKKYIESKLDDHLLFAENKPWLWGKGVSFVFYQYLYLRTSGNPLSVMNLMQNLLRAGFIVVSEKNPQMGIISEAFRLILDNEQTIVIEAPQCWVQVNGPIIDKLGCLEGLLMRSASVIGDIFDLQTLNKVHPFRDLIYSDRLMKILADLEAQDLFQILDISEDNIHYRFTLPFMRETLYQRMTYAQRRGIHRSVAEAIQSMTVDNEMEGERKKLEFHWIQAEQQSTANNERFSQMAKRSTIIKQMQQIMNESRNESSTVIKSGQLSRKSDKNVTWVSGFMVMTSRELKYYHNQNDFNADQVPQGSILLNNICGLIEVIQNQKGSKSWVFKVTTSTETQLRSLYLSAASEDQQKEWIIYLEFAKAKAIYDEFVQNFGGIQLPIGSNQDQMSLNLRASQKSNTMNFGCQQRKSSQLSPCKFNNNVETNDISDMKSFIKLFLKKSTLLFYSQLFEMSLQLSEDCYKQFGQNVKVVEQNQHFIQIEPSDFNFLTKRSKQISQLLLNRLAIKENDPQEVDSDSDDDLMLSQEDASSKRGTRSSNTIDIQPPDASFISKQLCENYISDQVDDFKRNINITQPNIKVWVGSQYFEQQKVVPTKFVHVNIVDLNASSQLEVVGVCIKDCSSLKGHSFCLSRGEEVIIKKIYKDNHYVKCIYQGEHTGIIRKSDLTYQIPDGLDPKVYGRISLKPKSNQLRTQQIEEILAAIKPASRQRQ